MKTAQMEVKRLRQHRPTEVVLERVEGVRSLRPTIRARLRKTGHSIIQRGMTVVAMCPGHRRPIYPSLGLRRD
jgi:hypothetical protein